MVMMNTTTMSITMAALIRSETIRDESTSVSKNMMWRYNESTRESFERRVEMSEQELKKSVEAIQNLRNDLTSSKEKALAFLVEAGIVTPSGELTKPYRQGA
jgi:predicted translin family RNA/ssDNA-binding protein